MSSVFDLESLYKSLLRHTTETIDRVKTQGISQDIEYYSWDSRGEVSEMDRGDLIGIAGWSFKENGGLWEVRCGLTISTYNDTNLFRELQILNIVHDMWGEGVEIPMINKITGEPFSSMVVSDFDMLPAGQAEKRNYRPVGLELLRTANASRT